MSGVFFRIIGVRRGVWYYGRRRVGKTFLVREALGNQFVFYLTGVAHTSTKQQLANFHEAILRYDKTFSGVAPANWFLAFGHLRRLVEGLKGHRKKDRGGLHNRVTRRMKLEPFTFYHWAVRMFDTFSRNQ